MSLTHGLRIRIGISSCLLGEEVRWDGGHKRDRFITETLGKYFEWVPVCPELEVGMGVPREAVRLIGSVRSPRMVGVESGTDWTSRMNGYSRQRARRLEEMDLSGCLLKSDSPSCGMERVRLHPKSGSPSRRGTGLFARALRERMPTLPVEEEGKLQDPRLRENFMTRVFAYRRWRNLEAGECGRDDLGTFHAAHKLLLLAHNPRLCHALDRLVARTRAPSLPESRERYGKTFMKALAKPGTVRGHFNVLWKLAGFLEGRLTVAEKRKVGELLEEYKRGRVTRLAPLMLLKHHVGRHQIHPLAEQVYLNPHPGFDAPER
jgi:uncharacterized protein YbbK (DUF523 family)/uncharacterized protein YbgA (DUF1722 family)